MAIDRDIFFDSVRMAPFAGRMSAGQVRGMNVILDTWEGGPTPRDPRWLAYALGTAFHETGRAMQPVRERGGRDYFFRMYDPASPQPERAALARRMGAHPGDGVVFYGRGFVQLTWRTNYARMGEAFGADLTSGATAADHALDPDLAARIMFGGMSEGIFTGVGFARYFNATTEDWTNARRIINGLDRAEAIADYAKAFHAALRDGA